MMKQKRRFNILALVLAMSLVLGAAPALAAGETSGSLTITEAIPGTTISLYQIQTKGDDNTFTTTSDFAKYSMDLELETSEEMRSAGTTLMSYILADQPTAFRTANVGDDGTVSFTDLPFGLYLAMGTTGTVDGKKYEQGPVMAYLPATEDDGTVVYDLTSNIKRSPLEEKDSYTVTKVWSDNDSTSRPKSIKVQLWQDGQKYGQQVTLSGDNNWKHTWSDLEKGHKYSVTEVSVPTGYTVKITEESGQFIVRNTKSSGGKETPTPTPVTPSRLPQTGQLWWPVPILAVLGIGLVLIGLLRSGKKK